MRIYRYRLPVYPNKRQKISIPFNHKILKIKESCKPDIISIWCSVDIDSDPMEFSFLILETGQEIAPGYIYLETVVIDGHTYHIFKL